MYENFMEAIIIACPYSENEVPAQRCPQKNLKSSYAFEHIILCPYKLIKCAY